jgi:hypothetical protein
MAESRQPGRPGRFLSAVVADSRAMMPRRSVFSDHDVDGPPALASDPTFAAPSRGEAPAARDAGTHSPRAAPGVARSRMRPSLPPYVMDRPARPMASAGAGVEMRGEALEAVDPDTTVASERRDEFQPVSIDSRANVSVDDSMPPTLPGPPSEASAGAVHDNEIRTSNEGLSPIGDETRRPPRFRHAAPPPRASSSSGSTAFETASSNRIATIAERSGALDVSARASDSAKAPTSERAPLPTTAQTAAQSAEPTPSPAKAADTATVSQAASPAAPRAPMNLTRPQRAAMPASSDTRPPTAPPSVHIGTIDVRIEAPKQRAEAPPRQPVSFSGSGMLSRLYLRRM